MNTVPTVRGDIDVTELGPTLMHEHVFVLNPDVQQNLGEWDERARIDDAVAKLAVVREAGFETIVDPTVIGLGRDVARVAKVAERVDLNIIVATGVYTYDTLPFYFMLRPPDALDEMFIRDLTEGIPGTHGVRAAFLKCAVDHFGMTRDCERILRAVARAHHVTGAPIMVHTNARKRTALDVDRVLGEEGVEPDRVLLAHVGDATDADYVAGLAALGYWLGMDRFGLNGVPSLEERVTTVAEVARRGHADRMMLAHDAACYIDWMTDDLLAGLPDWHFRHITDDVLPALRDRGVTDEQIDTMLVANPRRYFAGT